MLVICIISRASGTSSVAYGNYGPKSRGSRGLIYKIPGQQSASSDQKLVGDAR